MVEIYCNLYFSNVCKVSNNVSLMYVGSLLSVQFNSAPDRQLFQLATIAFSTSRIIIYHEAKAQNIVMLSVWLEPPEPSRDICQCFYFRPPPSCYDIAHQFTLGSFLIQVRSTGRAYDHKFLSPLSVGLIPLETHALNFSPRIRYCNKQ